MGESYSDDLPLAKALRTKLASANDSFAAQICDPWLSAAPSARFQYVLEGKLPDSQTIDVVSGCTQKFDATELAVDQPRLSVVADGTTVPMKVRLTADPAGLPTGDYQATVRATVPAAFRDTLEIPVVLTVAEPPQEPAHHRK